MIKNMQFVSVYTVPAFEHSIETFREYKGYLFSDDGDGKYNIDEIKKSSYLGVGNPNFADSYVQIKYIGKIIEVIDFEIIINHEENSISFVDENLDKNIQTALRRLIEDGFRCENGVLRTNFSLKWHFVKVKDDVIKIDEDILYPKRKIVAIPLNNNERYTKMINLLDNIVINEKVSINTKNNYFIIDGKKYEMDSINADIYSLTLKHIFTSENENKSFSVNDNEKEKEFLELMNKSNNSGEKIIEIKSSFLKDSIVKRFNDSFSKKVGFKLSFSQNKKLNSNDLESKNNVIYIK